MVFFSCLNCGESLQKPRVEKHYQTVCRGAVAVSCMDCFKDFRGQEFVSHNKCITEDQRYGGKNFQMKSSAFKGLQKQEQWTKSIQQILKDHPKLPSDQRQLLNIIVKHDNVPRKLAKFQNFVRTVHPKTSLNAVTAVFTLLENEHKKNVTNNVTPKPETPKQTPEENGATKQNGNLNVANGFKKEKTIQNGNQDKFKWKPTILYYVNKKKTIKNKKLMDKVLQAYKSYHPELAEVPVDAVKKYHLKLSKMRKVFIENDLVKLKV